MMWNVCLGHERREYVFNHISKTNGEVTFPTHPIGADGVIENVTACKESVNSASVACGSEDSGFLSIKYSAQWCIILLE